ncbi:dicarboxylate/amino acid:cation symporter [Thermococci archaeon]|nr:MAG: dicarboxylate/amino acid:cation symporter [Thermococci archaeon]
MNFKEIWKRYQITILVAIGLIWGTVAGLIFKEKAMVLRPLGLLFVYMLFTIIVPIVLITITTAVASLADLKKLGRLFVVTLLIFMFTGAIAGLYMLLVTKAFPVVPPGVSLGKGELEEISFSDALVNTFVVKEFYLLLSYKHMLPLIIFSILLGFAIAIAGEEATPIVDLLQRMNTVALNLVKLVMYFAPIGIGAYFAYIIGKLGSQFVEVYGRIFILAFVFQPIYWIIAYTLIAYLAAGSKGVRMWWQNILPQAITALGTCSSVGTLPIALDVARRLRIPGYIRNIVLPIGATIHMDGAAMETIMRISGAFALLGTSISGPGNYIKAIAMAILAGVAISGVPGGGHIANALIISLYGFPLDVLPLFIAIATIGDSVATMVNSTGDTGTSMLIARILEGPKWYEKNIE